MNTLPSINELIELANTDPDKLEQLRLQEIESLISSAPPHMQRRLRGLQFQIDCQRRLHRTSLGACLAISSMMMESVQQLNKVLQGDDACADNATHSPQIIPFSSAATRSPLHV